MTNDARRYAILGPLDVRLGSRRLDVPAGRQRTLLATLLLNPNRVVSVDEIVDRVWGERPPQRPRAALHTYVTRLRHSLEPLPPVETTAGGYLIETDAHELDLLRFRELSAEAERADRRHDLDTEAHLLEAALDLWHGPLLPDITSDSLRRDVLPTLHEERLQVVERRNEVAIELGHHDDVVAELKSLTHRHRYREKLWHQLMLALYRGGRTVEALQTYGRLTNHLRAEFGVDPGDDLQRLHLAILRSEPR
ncbi:AfsR/SARP family transcriptional regulator [Kineosporia succinea]|uniref:DNA-binding SARP family transcriptional activator n=1 Tax=Kineosporia succinea TaxID=84632 RepID=A0ABT9PF38_9ACTN|nr:AfsR/SARP family transcriptional regulator [Kineosporia succinea]MDP9831106.1 DNA-binding SARP family transcriptional activator [Kineosporia succinea]